jgi:hypothetical protein
MASRARPRCALAPAAFAAAALFGLAAVPLRAAAVDFLWFGGTGDWEHDPNWLPNGVPGIGDSAEIKMGQVRLLQEESVTRLQMSGGEMLGATLNVLGSATLSGGLFSGPGTNRFLGEAEVVGNGSVNFQLGRRIEVGPAATLRWHGNTLVNGNFFRADGTILNQGAWRDENAMSTLLGGSFGTVIRNEGLYTKTGAGTTTIAARYDNVGTTQVLAGDLFIMYGGTATGTFDIASAGTLSFGGGSVTHTITPGAKLEGTGRLRVTPSQLRMQGSRSFAGTVFIDTQGLLTLDAGATLTTAGFLQTSGTLSSGNLVATGAAGWELGAQSHAGTSEFRGTLSIRGDGYKTLNDSRVLRVVAGATAVWEGNSDADGNWIGIDAASKVRNEGVWEDRNAWSANLHPTSFHGGGRFENIGRYVKLGTATTNIGVTFDNPGELLVEAGTVRMSYSFANAGIVDVGAGAVLLVEGSSFRNDGRIGGDGTVRTPAGGGLVNAGVIGPGRSTGVLTLDSDLRSTASAVLEIELGASGADRLDVLDDATFDGTLRLVSAGYVPVLGASFVVATFDERLGGSTFDSVLASGFAAGVGFAVSYGTHDVTVTVSTVPEPATAWLWVAALGGLACRRWRQASPRR